MNFFLDEKKRRKLNEEFDTKPSPNHCRNYLFSKKYIKNKKVLDVGCWTGQFEELAMKDAKQIIGIDPGEDAINYAKERLPKVKFLIGTLDTINFSKNSFDVVTLFDVLEHLPKNTEVYTLKKIYSLLKPNSYLIITTPNDHLLSVILDPAFFLLGHRHYSEKKLRELLKKSGFELIDSSVKGGFVQAIFNNISLLIKHLLGRKVKEREWIKKIIERENRAGGFLTNCVIARKTKQVP